MTPYARPEVFYANPRILKAAILLIRLTQTTLSDPVVYMRTPYRGMDREGKTFSGVHDFDHPGLVRFGLHTAVRAWQSALSRTFPSLIPYGSIWITDTLIRNALLNNRVDLGGNHITHRQAMLALELALSTLYRELKTVEGAKEAAP